MSKVNFTKKKLTRIIALVMALVMVISVIYVNNANKYVSAEEGDGTGEPQVFVFENNENITIADTTEQKSIYIVRNENVEIKMPQITINDENMTEIGWQEEGSDTSITGNFETGKTYKYYVNHTVTDSETAEETTASACVATVKVMVASQTVNVDNSTKTVTLNDSKDSITEDGNIVVFGEMRYKIQEISDSVYDSSFDKIQECICNDKDEKSADKTYTVDLGYFKDDTAGADEYISVDSVEVIRDFNPISITEYKVEGNNAADGTELSDWDQKVSIDIEAEFDEAGFMEVVYGENSLARSEITAAGTIKVTIPALSDSYLTGNACRREYVIKIGNGVEVDQTRTLIVNYKDNAINISGIDENPIYLSSKSANSDVAAIKAKIESQTDLDTSKTGILKVDGENTTYLGATIKIDDENAYDFNYDVSVTSDGNYSYELVATNTNGNKETKTINVIRDIVNPEISDLNVYVLSKAEGASSETEEVFDATNNKALSSADYKIVFDAKDTESGTGIDKVCYKVSEYEGNTEEREVTVSKEDTELTADGTGKYVIPIIKNNDHSAKTYAVAIIAYDKAGNESQKKTVYLHYIDDEIYIKNIKVNNKSYETETDIETGTDGLKDCYVTDANNIEILFDLETEASIAKSGEDYIVTASIPSASGDVSDTGLPLEYITDKIEDGKLILSYKLTLSREKSEKLIVAINAVTKQANNSTVIKQKTIQFVQIDLNDPEILESLTTIGGVAYDLFNSDVWINEPIVLLVSCDDKSEEDGLYASGVAKYTVKQTGCVESETNATQYSSTESISIKESNSTAGTNIQIVVYDKAGRSKEYNKIVKLDTIPPKVKSIKVNGNTIEASETGEATDIGAFSGDPTINIVPEDNISTTKCEVNINGSKVTGLTSCNINSKLSELLGLASKEELQDASYTIAVKYIDIAGNVSSEKKFKLTTDNTSPVISTIKVNSETITDMSKMQEVTADKKSYEKLLLKVSAADAISEIDHVIVRMEGETSTSETYTLTEEDGGVLNDYQIEVMPSKDINGTKVTIEIVDAEGNSTRNTYQWNFFVDKSPAEVELSVNGQTDNDLFLSGIPNIKAQDKDNIKVANRKMTITTPDGEKVELVSGYLNTNSLKTLIKKTVVDGKYTVKVEAYDKCGKGESKSLSFTVDNTKPVNDIKITNVAPPKMDIYYNTSYDGSRYGQYYNTNVNIAFSYTDEDIDTIRITDNGNDIGSLTNFAADKTANITISNEGVHVVTIYAKDKAGNDSVARSIGFTIDKTAPVLTTTVNGSVFTEGQDIRYLASTANVSVSVRDNNTDAGDLTRIVKMTRPSSSTETTTSKIGEGTTGFDTEADYEIQYYAIDRAGNRSADRTVKFRVDKTAPALTISGISEGGVSNKNVTISYGMNEAFYWDMTSAKINVYKAIDGQSEALLKTVDFSAKNANDVMSETFTEDGEYRFEFIAEDKTGNKANTAYTFMLDETAPVIMLSGVKNYDKTKSNVDFVINITEDFFKTNTIQLDGSKTDIDGKSVDIDFGRYNINISKVSDIKKLFSEDGYYEISVKCKDKAGNETKTDICFTIDTQKPQILDLSKYDGTILNKFAWDYQVDDIVKDLTVCDITLYLDGVEYDGLSDVSDGKHVLKVVATDELGNSVEKQVEFVLDTIAPNVIVTGIEDGQRVLEPVDIGVSLQINEDILDSVTLNGVEQTISDNTASFIVSEAGDYDIVIKAHDEAGNTIEKTIHFEYGKKFNPLWIVLLVLFLLLLLIVIYIVYKKTKNNKK